MDDILDPELAARAAALPKLDLSDLASARETERRMVGHLPTYDARIPLSVNDIIVQGQQDTAAVAARIYARTERSAPGPALLYLHGGGYVMGGVPMQIPQPDDSSSKPASLWWWWTTG